MELKNVATGSFEKIVVEEGICVLKHLNENVDTQEFKHDIDSRFIQFHFCLKGAGKFYFNHGRYALDVKEEHALLLYNPNRHLPLNLHLAPSSWLISLLISIKKFHALFSSEADYIHFLSEESKNKKYYSQTDISPSIAVTLNQILNYNLHPSVRDIYLRGKVYELIGLYFNSSEDPDAEQCPFLVDESNIKKIRHAKNIVISRMAEPPGLQELSEEIGLSLKKLKEGFKQIYGASVYNFLFDYKMEYARKMLETGNYNVNEVGLKVGYSTASHFIAAFKKKFGTTPKKYVMSLTS